MPGQRPVRAEIFDVALGVEVMEAAIPPPSWMSQVNGWSPLLPDIGPETIAPLDSRDDPIFGAAIG